MVKEKLNFISKYKIDLIDLIEEIKVDLDQEDNYADDYIDNKVTRWRNIIAIIDTLPNLKMVCLTRKTLKTVFIALLWVPVLTKNMFGAIL